MPCRYYPKETIESEVLLTTAVLVMFRKIACDENSMCGCKVQSKKRESAFRDRVGLGQEECLGGKARSNAGYSGGVSNVVENGNGSSA